ncbi:MAG: S26 family signal peptidase [bacterium]
MTDNIIYIDYQEAKTYTFQYDYYFMMGDHPYDSKDYRYIEPVPENRIIGKSRRIFFSGKDGFRYCRILKRI